MSERSRLKISWRILFGTFCDSSHVFFCTRSVLQDVHMFKIYKQNLQILLETLSNFGGFCQNLPPFIFPLFGSTLFVAWENLPGVTVVSLPAASWQRSLVPWEAFKIRVSAPSAVLVGAIAPWPRWQWTKHWLFRAYRGGIYYPVTWGSLWNNQDSMESKGPRVFLLSPTSTLVWGVCWLEGPPEIMGIPEGANPPSMPLKLRKHDWPLKQPMERSGDFDGW